MERSAYSMTSECRWNREIFAFHEVVYSFAYIPKGAQGCTRSDTHLESLVGNFN